MKPMKMKLIPTGIYLITFISIISPLKTVAELPKSEQATIIKVKKGTATLANSSNSVVRPAKPGAIVHFGDLIRPSKGAIVFVQCGKSKKEVRFITAIGDICPDLMGERERQDALGW